MKADLVLGLMAHRRAVARRVLMAGQSMRPPARSVPRKAQRMVGNLGEVTRCQKVGLEQSYTKWDKLNEALRRHMSWPVTGQETASIGMMGGAGPNDKADERAGSPTFRGKESPTLIFS
jgi:hypothetical protein